MEVRHYRLTLFGAILNVSVSERIVRRRIPKNTKKVILDSTKNKPFVEAMAIRLSKVRLRLFQCICNY